MASEKAPQAGTQARLKSIIISGTDLRWTLGEEHEYFEPDGDSAVRKVDVVVGLGFITPPPNQYGQVERQITIVYASGYRDMFSCADHLVVGNYHVSEIAVVQGPKLVVPKAVQ
jgi:hypothetical protein